MESGTGEDLEDTSVIISFFFMLKILENLYCDNLFFNGLILYLKNNNLYGTYNFIFSPFC